MTPVEMIWRAAGSPPPTETDGLPIRPRKKPGTHCAATGQPDAPFAWSDAYSENFTTMRNRARLFPFAEGSEIAVGKAHELALSAPAVWAAKCLALRCCPWRADETGLHFHPSRRYPKDRREFYAELYGVPDPPPFLEWLLQPPRVPCVIGYPVYGIGMGGELNLHRTWLRAPELVSPEETDPVKKKLRLGKLQSKHTAQYAMMTTDPGLVLVQVDDVLCAALEPRVWLAAKAKAEALLQDLGGGAAAREALTTGRPPAGADVRVLARWTERFEEFGGLPKHPFWPHFCGVLHSKKEEKEET